METRAKTRTEQILEVMHILAWIAYVGMLIEAVALVVYYGVSTIDHEWADKVRTAYELKQFSFLHYTLRFAIVLAGVLLKAYASRLAIKTLERVKIENPFRLDVALMIERISYVLLAAWIAAMVQNGHTLWLRMNSELERDWVSPEFIFAAAVVYVIAQIFKRGVELQSEHDLTV